MGKKKVVLFIIAGVLAVSGIAALPSGNITGGVGCIIIAAICVFFAMKKGGEKTAGIVAPAAGSRAAEKIRTKLVGVTFENEDGTNRQDILAAMTGNEEITVEKYTYNGAPAACIKWGAAVLGNLSADLAADLERKYPNAQYTAELLEISGGGWKDLWLQYRAFSN